MRQEENRGRKQENIEDNDRNYGFEGEKRKR